MGDQFLLARVLNNLGNVAYFLKEYAEAKQIYQESLALRTALDDRVGIGACLSNLGGVAVALGERQQARQYFQEALKVMVETNLAYAVPHILAEIAELLAQEGKKEQAAGVFALVAYHPASQKATRDKAQQLLAELESQLAPDVIAAAMEKGKVLKLEEVAGELLSEAL